MADISSYPTITPTSSDLVLIVDRSQDGNPTRTASVQSVANLANAIQLGYTSLVQLLTQTGTAAPVATEVYNNTGETFTWSYVSLGVYRVTSTGTPFTANKTVVFLNTGLTGNSVFEPRWSRVSDTVIEIVSGIDNFAAL